MSSPSAFFVEHALPVCGHLSTETKRQLLAYLEEGNQAFRQKRLLEFLKSIDWVSPQELRQDRLLQKLSPSLGRQVLREVEDYWQLKTTHRQENAEKREQYKLRVFEYFRVKMSAADKALLESLRDYELNLTGRDVNWRHYFSLDSFKKIDAFRHAGHEERQALFARFRQDVDTYKRNYEKIHRAQYEQACHHAFSFDDWCELMGDEAPRRSQAASGDEEASSWRRVSASGPENPVAQAYQTLQLSWNASPDVVKKQFRKLTLSHHPDLPAGSEEKMKAIIGAYQELQRYWQASSQV